MKRSLGSRSNYGVQALGLEGSENRGGTAPSWSLSWRRPGQALAKEGCLSHRRYARTHVLRSVIRMQFETRETDREGRETYYGVKTWDTDQRIQGRAFD